MSKKILLFLILCFSFSNTFAEEIIQQIDTGGGTQVFKCISVQGDNSNQITGKNGYIYCVKNIGSSTFARLSIYNYNGSLLNTYTFDGGQYNYSGNVGITVFNFGNGKHFVSTYFTDYLNYKREGIFIFNNGLLEYSNSRSNNGTYNGFYLKNLSNEICFYDYANNQGNCYNIGNNNITTENTVGIERTYNYCDINGTCLYTKNGSSFIIGGLNSYTEIKTNSLDTFMNSTVTNFTGTGINFFKSIINTNYITFGVGEGTYSGTLQVASGGTVASYVNSNILILSQIQNADINTGGILEQIDYGSGNLFYSTYIRGNYIYSNTNTIITYTGTVYGGGGTGTGGTGTGNLTNLVNFNFSLGIAKINSGNCAGTGINTIDKYINSSGGLSINYNQNYKFVDDWNFLFFGYDLGLFLSDTINSVLYGTVTFLFTFLDNIFYYLVEPLTSSFVEFTPGNYYCFFDNNIFIQNKPTTTATGENIPITTSFDYFFIILCTTSILFIFIKKDD